MVALGYALLGEAHAAPDLVRHAVQAERAGFSFAAASDHFHPWTPAQGQSPFVWATLGAVAAATDRLVIGTAVTCPTTRMHPAIVAQATATLATLAPDRFFFAVGTGEYLNEHILGAAWPPLDIRLEMLTEAIEVIRALWQGREWSHEGKYFTVHRARLYSLPVTPPALLVAASGRKAAAVAATYGDGLVNTSSNREVVEMWRKAGRSGPRMGMLHVAFAPTRAAGREIVAKHWPHAPLPHPLHTDLSTPGQFARASTFIRPEDYDDRIPQGPDPRGTLEGIARFAAAGYDHVLLHQIGPSQDGFLEWFQKEVAPAVQIDPPALTSMTPRDASDTALHSRNRHGPAAGAISNAVTAL